MINKATATRRPPPDDHLGRRPARDRPGCARRRRRRAAPGHRRPARARRRVGSTRGATTRRRSGSPVARRCARRSATAVHGRDPAAARALVDRRDTLASPFYGGGECVRITAIRTQRLRLPLDPPFHAAWDPVPRAELEATVVRVQTDEGVTGDRQRRHDGRLRASSSTCSSAATRWRCRPRPRARDDRLPRRPVLAGRGGAVGPRRAGARRSRVGALLGGRRSGCRVRVAGRAARPGAARRATRGALVEQGFRAVKVRIARDRLDEGIAVVAAVRDAVGDRLEIMVDLNQWWRMPGDIEPGSARPTRGGRWNGCASTGCCGSRSRSPAATCAGCGAAASTGVRIAGGEMARTFEELRLALEARRARRLSARCRAGAGDLRRPYAGRPGAAAQPLVHPPHVDQRDRPAGQPARVLRRRRRARFWSTPTTLRAGPRSAATSCSPRRCGSTGDGCLAVPGRPRARDRARRGGGGVLCATGSGSVMTRVAFVGLGHMGGPMCGHVSHGRLRVDRVRPRPGGGRRARRAGRAGSWLVADCPRARVARHEPARAARRSSSAARADGAIAALAPGRAGRRHEHELARGRARGAGRGARARGIDFVDAPVAGQTIGAEAGTLAIYAGGTAEAFARALPSCEAIGDPERIFHVGPQRQPGTRSSCC